MNTNNPKTSNAEIRLVYPIITSEGSKPRCVYLIYKDNFLDYFDFQSLKNYGHLFLKKHDKIQRKIAVMDTSNYLNVGLNVVWHPWVDFTTLPTNIVAVKLDEFSSVNNTSFFGRSFESLNISPIVRKTIMLCTE